MSYSNSINIKQMFVGGRLPVAYQEVAYIGRNGNNYIDTGRVPNQTKGFEVKMGFKIADSGYRYAILTNYNNGGGDCSLELNSGSVTNNRTRFCINVSGSASDFFSSNSINTSSFNDISWKCDGTSTGSTTVNGTVTTGTVSNGSYYNYTAYMFIDRNLRWSDFSHNSFVSYCKIYEGGKLIKDFIPCYRKSDGVIGFYDAINGVFHTNQTSGTFSKGPDVRILPEEYQQVEYIGRNGNNYIDTGWIPKINSNFEVKFGAIFPTSGLRYCMLSNHINGQSGQVGFELNSGSQTGNKARFWCGSSSPEDYFSSNAVTIGALTDITYRANGNGNNSIILNGTTTAGTLSNSNFFDGSAYLFVDRALRFSDLKDHSISYCKIWEEGVLIKDFVACYRKSDLVAGFYDLVSGEFYTNQGTGTFSKGRNVGSWIDEKYQQVDYIGLSGSSGTGQYIKTGFKANQNSAIEMKADISTTNNNGCFFCSRDTGSINYFVLFRISSNLRFDYKDTQYSVSYGLSTNTPYTVKADKNKLYVNDVLKTTATAGTFQATSQTLLGASRIGEGNSLDNCRSGKIYYAKIWDNGTLVRHFIPCFRKSDSVIGLLDIVNNVFYTNAGTGSFTKGGDI